MDEQQQELAAFESSIAEALGDEPTATGAEEAPAVESQTPEPISESAQPEATEQPETPEPGEAEPENKGEAKTEDEDPVLLDGLKRSELRRLLGNAADVETLKRQIDKAHGHIGELNRRLQQTPAPAASRAPAAQELPPELKQFEADYPEVAQYVRALGITPQQRQEEAPPADVQQPAQADAQPAQAGPDPLDIEMAVMDRMHKGWREKLAAPEFSTWLASQGEQVREEYDTAKTADAMASVLGKFDQWASARTAAADKVAKGQQRLQRSMTPSGNAPRPQGAPTEMEAFEAALKAAASRR
jgi:hypothetical protein